jgi:hypothetical protein
MFRPHEDATKIKTSPVVKGAERPGFNRIQREQVGPKQAGIGPGDGGRLIPGEVLQVRPQTPAGPFESAEVPHRAGTTAGRATAPTGVVPGVAADPETHLQPTMITEQSSLSITGLRDISQALLPLDAMITSPLLNYCTHSDQHM